MEWQWQWIKELPQIWALYTEALWAVKFGIIPGAGLGTHRNASIVANTGVVLAPKVQPVPVAIVYVFK